MSVQNTLLRFLKVLSATFFLTTSNNAHIAKLSLLLMASASLRCGCFLKHTSTPSRTSAWALKALRWLRLSGSCEKWLENSEETGEFWGSWRKTSFVFFFKEKKTDWPFWNVEVPECVTLYLKQQTLVEGGKRAPGRVWAPSGETICITKNSSQQNKLVIGTLDMAKARVFPWHLEEVTLTCMCVFPQGAKPC